MYIYLFLKIIFLYYLFLNKYAMMCFCALFFIAMYGGLLKFLLFGRIVRSKVLVTRVRLNETFSR